MSQEILLSRPDLGDLGLVADLFDTALHPLKTALVKRCGGEVQLRIDPPQVRSLAECLQPPDPLALGAAAPFTLAPSNLRGLIVLDVPLVQRLVGLFLGEDPTGTDTRPVRRLTRLDLRFSRLICEDLLASMLLATTIETPPTGSVGPIATNARSVVQLPQSSSIIQVEIELGPEDQPFGRCTVLLPAQCSGVLWPERRRITRPGGRDVDGLHRVLPIQVPVVAELARQQVPMSTLRSLEVGHVLNLGRLDDAELRVSGHAALAGDPGEQDGVRSVRIRQRIKERARSRSTVEDADRLEDGPRGNP